MAYITNPISKRRIISSGPTARNLYKLCKDEIHRCYPGDMAILELQFGKPEPEIDCSKLPHLPFEMIDKIIHILNGKTYRNICKNYLISKDINNIPFEFKFDAFGDLDEFFMYHAKKYTLGQLKNPVRTDEILFANQFAAMIDIMTEKDRRVFIRGQPTRGTAERTRYNKLWVYRLIVLNFALNRLVIVGGEEIDKCGTDTDSLFEFREKLITYITPRNIFSNIDMRYNNEMEKVYIRDDRRRR